MGTRRPFRVEVKRWETWRCFATWGTKKPALDEAAAFMRLFQCPARVVNRNTGEVSMVALGKGGNDGD